VDSAAVEPGQRRSPRTGLFTAAADGEGLVTVTAAVDGTNATVSIAVGQRF